ncbi:MAG TPA: vitamin B12 dependent-methionine synthase activation domain-containing protein [candidate division Zixibacteria bacterium]|nr:vitamin B12 dependent-methionine synthase activation domain-containing protein [candidate division Zixibacteria bacterium]
MKLLDDFTIKFDTREIVKLLRRPNSSKKPSENLLKEIEELYTEALSLINTKAIFDIFPSSKLTPRHMFTLSEYTILAICTLSDSIENKISKLIESGELSKGVILDAIASHAAELLADELNKKIILEFSSLVEGKKITKRFSPGYCRWTIEEGQKLIFSLLPAEKIKVKLSNSMMMIPRKSISFALNIGEKVEKELGEKECDSCNMFDCEFRRS